MSPGETRSGTVVTAPLIPWQSEGTQVPSTTGQSFAPTSSALLLCNPLCGPLRQFSKQQIQEEAKTSERTKKQNAEEVANSWD